MQLWFFLIAALAVGVILEQQSIQKPQEGITVREYGSKYLLEPDEPFELYIEVENRRRLPIMYLSVLQVFARGIEPLPDSPTSSRVHISDTGIISTMFETAVSVKSHHLTKEKQDLIIHERGVYRVGSLKVSIGDFLGITSSDFDIPYFRDYVVVPRRLSELSFEEALGGFIGELSVQRFLFEDPILMLGTADYTGREPMKDISWKHSARSQNLIVKTYDHTTENNVCILFELPSKRTDDMEYTFSLVRTLCETLDQKQIPWSLDTNANLYSSLGKWQKMGRGIGREHLSYLLEGLGRADGRVTGSLHNLVSGQVRKTILPNGYLIVADASSPRVRQEAQYLKTLTLAEVSLVSSIDGSFHKI